MRKVLASCFVLTAVSVAACGESLAPEPQLSNVSGTEELVSESMIAEVEAMSDRADFRTDVPNSDRVCDISDGTIAAANEMVVKASALSRYLNANYARTASAHIAPTFTTMADEFHVTLQRPNSCRTIVVAFLRMARAGHALGANLHEEGLIRKDDRLGLLVRAARTQFVEVKRLLRQDLGHQVTDRKVSDARPVSDRP